MACGPIAFDDLHARTPCVAVEVTSSSTRGDDQTIPSLQAYVVAEQAMRRLECYVRGADGAWTHAEVSGATGVDTFVAPCGGGVLRLRDVYDDTDVPPAPPGLFDAPASDPTDAGPPA